MCVMAMEGRRRGILTYAHSEGTAEIAESDPRAGISRVIHFDDLRCRMRSGDELGGGDGFVVADGGGVDGRAMR